MSPRYLTVSSASSHRVDPDASNHASRDAAHLPVDIRSAALTIIAAIATILILQYAQAMIIPIILGALISYALDPIVTAICRTRLPRAVAAAIVMMALVVAGGALLYGLRSEARAIVDQLPQAARRLRQTIENDRPRTASAIQQVQKAATELEKAADAAATPSPAPSGVTRVQVETPFNASDYLLWGSIGLATAIGQLVLIFFLVYFLLASGDLYKRKLVKIVGSSMTKKKVTLQILEQIDRQIEMYLLVQLLRSGVIGVATWLAFRTIGVQQAAVWGVLAGMFSSIPYFGPVLVTGAMGIIGFLQFGNVEKVALIVGVTFAITAIEGLLLTSRFTDRTVRMNAVAIFVGLLFWGWMWNVWGLLLAVPIMMVIKAVCDHIEDFQGIGELLGD